MCSVTQNSIFHFSIRDIVFVCVGLIFCGISIAGQHSSAYIKNLLEIDNSKNAVITIHEDQVVRENLPSTLFGFNINHFHFQNDFWNTHRQAIEQKIIDALKLVEGSIYRYPGGLVANRFSWEDSIEDSTNRKTQKIVKWKDNQKVLFGVGEYLEFLSKVGGAPWYVLNLVGWDQYKMINELPGDKIAKSNARLALYIKNNIVDSSSPRYYQLGNELDRAKYQWDHQKYINRARKSIEAIQKVDKDARFVAFLRDFDWKYRGVPGNKVSRYQDLMREVLKELPMINDISFHYYYDEKGSTKKYRRISWRLKQFLRAIDYAKSLKKGKSPNIWITEHARTVEIGTGKAMKNRAYTSNLSATLSTTDFIAAIAQIPEIKGAFLHGLNAGPWQIFDASVLYNDLRPRPIYWGIRILKVLQLPIVLATKTSSPNKSGYLGGYDLRATAFTDPDRKTLGLWLINRDARSVDVKVLYKPFSNRTVSISHSFMAGKENHDPDDPYLVPEVQIEPVIMKSKLSEDGYLTLKIPPASVSSFKVKILD